MPSSVRACVRVSISCVTVLKTLLKSMAWEHSDTPSCVGASCVRGSFSCVTALKTLWTMVASWCHSALSGHLVSGCCSSVSGCPVIMFSCVRTFSVRVSSCVMASVSPVTASCVMASVSPVRVFCVRVFCLRGVIILCQETNLVCLEAILLNTLHVLSLHGIIMVLTHGHLRQLQLLLLLPAFK
ncbi:hypothetical protein LDENG_00281120 [Lucifuga dentata]|nr:hypothetical protein LDENG_00281120 [Lucifuga dentata]